MTHIALSKTAGEMEQFAHLVYKDITNGPGTAHARLRRLGDLLNALAKENYDAGVEDGKKQAAEEAAKAKEAKALVAGLSAIKAAATAPELAT